LSYNLVEKPTLRLRNRLLRYFNLYASRRQARHMSVPGSGV
jgi:hypothetical protein